MKIFSDLHYANLFAPCIGAIILLVVFRAPAWAAYMYIVVYWTLLDIKWAVTSESREDH